MKLHLKKSSKPFWLSKEEQAEVQVKNRRMQGELLARLVEQANPARDPASETAHLFDAQRGASVARAEAVTASLQEYPHDPDALAAFRINVKDVAATRPYLVVPPITAPRKHRTAVEARLWVNLTYPTRVIIYKPPKIARMCMFFFEKNSRATSVYDRTEYACAPPSSVKRLSSRASERANEPANEWKSKRTTMR